MKQKIRKLTVQQALLNLLTKDEAETILTKDSLGELAKNIEMEVNEEYLDLIWSFETLEVWLDYAIDLFKQGRISRDNLVVIIDFYDFHNVY